MSPRGFAEVHVTMISTGRMRGTVFSCGVHPEFCAAEAASCVAKKDAFVKGSAFNAAVLVRLLKLSGVVGSRPWCS